METRELALAIRPYREQAGLEVKLETLTRAVPLVQERLKTLQESVDWLRFLFKEVQYDPALLIGKKMDLESSQVALQKAREMLGSLTSFDEETLDPHLRWLADELNLKPGQLFGIIRVAVTGQRVAPPLFGSLSVLGQDLVLARIDAALQAMQTLSAG